MFRRLTSRRTLKWTGTITCILLATVFVASRYLYAYVGSEFGRHGITVDFTRGGITVTDWHRRSEDLNPAPNYGIGANRGPSWDHALSVGFDSDVLNIRWQANIPIWLPLIFLLLPTLLLWRLDRRRPLPGHCKKCNYNLTGNTSGRCPECGSSLEQSVEKVDANQR